MSRLRAQLRTLLTDALLWSMLIALTMATLGGLHRAQSVPRSLANISATATAIAGGDFAGACG